jgi:uncharacterized protein YdaU (DUF1376 family)
VKEKSPAFQFYPRDFLIDGNVAAMSLQERGAYITLLCLCWQEQTLPTDPKRLAHMVGVGAPAFSKLWPALKTCFQEVDGRLVHPRLEKERDKQRQRRELAKENGHRGAAHRWQAQARTARLR